ncbi:MAG: caspase family protein [Salinivirgaceae bacterium]
MKALAAFTFFLFFAINIIWGQKIIHKQTVPKEYNLKPEYKRGLPPNLYAALEFSDANGNGILEAEEKATLLLTLINKGKGNAQDMQINIKDNHEDTAFHYKKSDNIYLIHPNDSAQITIPIKAGFHVKSENHQLAIEVKEMFGYDMDPAILKLNTLEFQKARLNLAGIEIMDYGDNTLALLEDGLLQAGEQVKVRVIIQNIGQNIAENVNYQVKTTDQNIYLENTTGVLGNLEIGQTNEFEFILSPNKRVKTQGRLSLFLNVSENRNLGNIKDSILPIELNQRPALAQVLDIKPVIDNLKNQVASFEFTSNKIKGNIGTIQNIYKIHKSKTSRPNAIAVIIGIEKYKNNLAPAPFAENDADIMTKYFKKVLGVETVYTYKSDEVHGFFFQQIFNPVNGELQKAIVRGETELFIYYSGHGIPDKSGENIFLFPSDGNIEMVDIQGYNLNTFYNDLITLGAKSTTVFIDACFSGSSKASEKIETQNLIASKGVIIHPKIIEPWQSDSTFCVFNSSSFNETSLGFDQSQTGLFTYYLCSGLQGAADFNKDSCITSGELGSFLIQKIPETARKISSGKQTPEFHGNQEFILTEY